MSTNPHLAARATCSEFVEESIAGSPLRQNNPRRTSIHRLRMHNRSRIIQPHLCLIPRQGGSHKRKANQPGRADPNRKAH
jgi:hypothetical protein